MSSINSKRRGPEPEKSELPVPVRWVEGEELETEGWHEDWDEGPASHISMLSEAPAAEEPEIDPLAEEDARAWLEGEGEGEGDGDGEDGGDAVVGESAEASAEDGAQAPTSESTGTSGGAEDPRADDQNDEDDEDDEKRRGRRRSKTIARKQMLRERRRMLAQGTIPEIVDYDRPTHRVECRDAKRPCLYVSCRYHLYLDVNPMTGSIKLNFPDKEVWELAETCALDVAERGGITLEEVGEIMNLTRERIRQVEVSGLEKLKHGDVKLHTFIDGRELQSLPPPPKRLPIVDD